MARLPEASREVSFRERANSAVHRGGRPVVLKIAEFFLMLIVGMYLAKIVVLAVGLYDVIGMHRTSLLTYVVEIFMLYLTVDSLFVVSSRNPRAWKKVSRASMLLIIFNLIYWFGSSSMTTASYVVVNPLIITPMALFIMVVMYWAPIRRYYMPVMEDERTIWQWFKFSWFSPLYTSKGYRVMYDDRD